MAISKIILNGVTQMDLTSDTVAANNLISPNTAHDAAGLPVVGTASGGIDAPVFTITWDEDNDYQVLSVSCNKTYNEIYSLTNNDGFLAAIENATVVGTGYSYEYTNSLSFYSIVGTTGGDPRFPAGTYLVFISSAQQPRYDLWYGESGTITIVRPSEFARTLTATVNGTYEPEYGDYSYTKVIVNVPSSSPNLQAKTNIAPTTSSQTITADSGYDGLSSVQINAMPTGTEGTPTATKGTVSNHSISVTPSVTNTAGYISGGTHSGTAVTVTASELDSGTKQITQNGQGIDVVGYASVDVSVSAPASNLQSKTATPTESVQTITPDSGYDGLSAVEVGAISSTYVGSGITRRSSSDVTQGQVAGEYEVSAPAGYYASAVTKYVPRLSFPSATSSTSSGTSQATISRSTSNQYLNIPTGYNAMSRYYTISATPNMTLPSAASDSSSGTSKATITPTTSNQYLNIPTGYNETTQYYTISAVTYSTITVSSSNPSGGNNGDVWIKTS